MTHDPQLVRIISDCMCRSDGLDPSPDLHVFDKDGEARPADEWYSACAEILIDRLQRNGFVIVREHGE